MSDRSLSEQARDWARHRRVISDWQRLPGRNEDADFLDALADENDSLTAALTALERAAAAEVSPKQGGDPEQGVEYWAAIEDNGYQVAVVLRRKAIAQAVLAARAALSRERRPSRDLPDSDAAGCLPVTQEEK